jgi:hypothetical protein
MSAVTQPQTYMPAMTQPEYTDAQLHAQAEVIATVWRHAKDRACLGVKLRQDLLTLPESAFFDAYHWIAYKYASARATQRGVPSLGKACRLLRRTLEWTDYHEAQLLDILREVRPVTDMRPFEALRRRARMTRFRVIEGGSLLSDEMRAARVARDMATLRADLAKLRERKTRPAPTDEPPAAA